MQRKCGYCSKPAEIHRAAYADSRDEHVCERHYFAPDSGDQD